jgi:hypothetical protein
MTFAYRAFQKKYGSIPRPGGAERAALLALVKKHGADELQVVWTDLLQRDRLSPNSTLRPFSELICRLSEQRVHDACVDARAHIPPPFYGLYNWAFYVLSKQGTASCWLSARVAGRWCCLSRSSANKAIRWLVRRGWFIELQAPTENKGGRYKVLGHDEWIAQRGGGYSPEEGETCVMQLKNEKL